MSTLILNLKLNCQVQVPSGNLPSESEKVKPNWMIFNRSTLNFSVWYRNSLKLSNFPTAFPIIPGNSVSFYVWLIHNCFFFKVFLFFGKSNGLVRIEKENCFGCVFC
eukprot:Anaeramoba_flamelloidesc38842_g1_i2.p2 GENE.c38842_g1_i2~~c38842_g1_i2.p2  ORF type:complete len:107 (+),score=8.29 c38842_g1_i2:377-697(+)